MTKEEKQLLISDLCARLPYGPMVRTSNDNDSYKLLSIHFNKGVAVIGMLFDDVYVASKVRIDDIKPYLRPLSSMSDEEYEEFNMERVEHQLKCIEICDKREAFEVGMKFDAEDLEYLYSHHYDVRGLIPMGIAESTEKFNPYK